MRAASPELQKEWEIEEEDLPDDNLPREWEGVTWSGNRVIKLDLGFSKIEVLPPEIGQLLALTSLIRLRLPAAGGAAA